jgi:transcriptional regulator with XRE-family HTH domain
MMADTFVDPALFRLRAFEVEWLEPLKTELYDRTRGRTAESDSTALLLCALVAEAERWLTVGQQVGYFTHTSSATSPLSLPDPPELEWLLSTIRSQIEFPSGFGIQEFGQALAEARDDFTAERREFLRLVYFTDEVEWLERLHQIRTIPDELIAQRTSGIANEVTWGLDDFRWSTSGDSMHPPGESESTVSEPSDTTELQQHLPAKWRLGSFALIARQSPVAGRRLAELAEAQASIITVLVEGLMRIKHTASATLQPTSEAETHLRSHDDPRTSAGILEPLRLRPQGKRLSRGSVGSGERQISGAVALDPAIHRRRLRSELRNAREAAGKTQRDVAVAMDWSQSKLIRIESGAVNIGINDLRALLNYYNVGPARIEDLVNVSRAGRETPPWSIYKSVASPQYLAFLGYESSAAIIRNFEPFFVPSLLQTEEYARTVISSLEAHVPYKIDPLVELCMERQELLERQPPVDLHWQGDAMSCAASCVT